MKDRLEKLVFIWYLQSISRSLVIHLLNGKNAGCFIVRKSSQPNAMALSVRLPDGKGPYIEHYLIEINDDGQFHLEGSVNFFANITELIAHYCQCCDELPVQLTLPPALLEASGVQLHQLSLMGVDFWLADTKPIVTFDQSLKKPLVKSNSSSSTSDKPLISIIDEPIIDASKSSSVLQASGAAPPPPKPPPRSTIQNSTNIKPLLPTECAKSHTGEALEMMFNFSHDDELNCSLREYRDLSDLVDAKVNQSSKERNGAVRSESMRFKSAPANRPPLSSQSNANEKSAEFNSLKSGPQQYCSKNHGDDKSSDYEDIWSCMNESERRRRQRPKIVPRKSCTDKAVTLTKEKNNTNTGLNEVCLEISPISAKIALFNSGGRPEKNGLQLDFKKNSEVPKKPKPVDDTRHPVHNEKTPEKNIEKLRSSNDHQFGSDSNLTHVSVRSLPSRCSYSLESLLNAFRSPISDDNPIPECRDFVPKKLQDASVQVSSQSWKPVGQKSPTSSVCSSDIGSELLLRNEARRERAVASSSRAFIDSSWRWHASREKLELQGAANVTTDTEYCSNYSPSRNFRRSTNLEEKEILDRERADLNRYRRISARYNTLNIDSENDASSTDCELNEIDVTSIKKPTIKELIAMQKPELRVSEEADKYDEVETFRRRRKVSKEDAERVKLGRNQNSKISSGTNTDNETIFSEPWDSRYWESFITRPKKLDDSDDDDEGEDGETNDIKEEEQEESGNFVTEEPIACLIQKNGINDLSKRIKDLQAVSSARSSSEVDEVHSLRVSDPNEITEVTSFMWVEVGDEETLKKRLNTTFIGEICDEENDQNATVGRRVGDYIHKLVADDDNTFAKSVQNFIQCTKECQETSPQVVMRNVRQFMNGMKNYLVKHGEKNFLEMVKEERNKLKSNKFLNIDAIIECTLHELVIKPLKAHLTKLLTDEYKRNGSIQLISDVIRYAQTRTPGELGVRPDLWPPDLESIGCIKKIFKRMQESSSPLKKLEFLLAAISKIYSSIKKKRDGDGAVDFSGDKRGEKFSIGADEFLPIFTYVIVHCDFESSEIEADYMWGLLHSSLLSGEGGYYLTTLSSCVHVLKSIAYGERREMVNEDSNGDRDALTVGSSMESLTPPMTPNTTLTTVGNESFTSTLKPSISGSGGSGSSSTLNTSNGYMKVMIPNELSCTIVVKTLPVRPNMTVRDVCKMIAHKFNMINCDEYGLFKISGNGEETQLEPADFPLFDVKMMARAPSFAFKRVDAKFIWPKIED